MRKMLSVPGWVSRFLVRAKREDGAVAVQFALLIVPMTVMVFGAIDVSRASGEKARLQDALDAATLAAARSTETTDAGLKTVGDKVLSADLAASKAVLASSTYRLEGTKIIATARASMTTSIANLWMDGDMTVGATSEVTRSSNNLEVALALDVTGSMGGSRIADLKLAAKDLVDLVVQDQQTPYYTSPPKV
ncbi:MAG: pilus assembly protein TadG-related protein [Caulobacter sp.]